MKTVVQVFGLEWTGLDWPPDFEVRRASWPPEDVVLVPWEARNIFQEQLRRWLHTPQARKRGGRLPEAILLLPTGARPSAELRILFDAVVREGDWDQLRKLLRCPQRWKVLEEIADLPREALFAPEEEAFFHPALPESTRAHLERCAECREAFREMQAKARQSVRRLCPSPRNLARFLRRGGYLRTAQHLQSCPACRAEAELLVSRLPGALPPSLWYHISQALQAIIPEPRSSTLLALRIAASKRPRARWQRRASWQRQTRLEMYSAPLLDFWSVARGRLAGWNWAVEQSLDSMCLILGMRGRKSQRVRVALYDPAWREPVLLGDVELRPVGTDLLGAKIDLPDTFRVGPHTLLLLSR
jgi:hypothetical protein|nr:MAG: hypothetical protein KatS3mg041_1161 [Bacteroidota bacterium]